MLETILTDLRWASFITFVATLVFCVVFVLIDTQKERKVKGQPFLSFILPTYNDGKYIAETIKSIYNSYNKKKFEIIIVNDNSPDNTREILSPLRKKYKFTLVNNKENKGKAVSVNNAYKMSKGEIVFVVDSDTLLSKEAIHDIIARFQNNPKVGGVSCRYKVLNRKGFLPLMQDVEYNMLALIQGSYNIFSTISLWGGCMAFKRDAFEKIGMLSPNFLTEDMDAALKLGEEGWKAEQSSVPVYTQVPEKFRRLYGQKMRWSEGFMQNFIQHTGVFLRNPLAVFFVLSYVIFMFTILVGLINNYYTIKLTYDMIGNLTTIGFSFFSAVWFLLVFYSADIVKNVAAFLVYPLLSMPYIAFDKKDRRKVTSFLLVFPYSLIYFPIYTVISIIGFSKAIWEFSRLKKADRSW
jgi:cellulose synthase/poly-beta-1,6-N-acetylglucosamine synthase-like glycosyltransferase